MPLRYKRTRWHSVIGGLSIHRVGLFVRIGIIEDSWIYRIGTMLVHGLGVD